MASGLEQRIEEGNFRNFDVVQVYSGHHYAKNKIQNCFTDTRSCVYRKIMKEWKILDNNLPDSIFVRVYENRIDLLTAVIIGAQGTPYHDALFFFDIAFPSNYPEKPPQVFYRSHGLRLNPNLYDNGYVCLSLLNSWFGKGNERWNPAASTILQVLVSIQGLVLNAKPYYNEPAAINLARNWKNYNEKVFALSCKTMLLQLQNPPRNFESFVADHFRKRAFSILRASKAYRDGCVRIGLFSDNWSSSSSQDNYISVSSKFIQSMDKLGPQLFAAFSKNGASLQNIFEKKKEIAPKIGENIFKKKNFDVLHKVLEKLELCLGLKDKTK